MSLFYYDFETTGLNPFDNKIIEYCFMKPDGSYVNSLVNPGVQISDKIQQITHITNNDLHGMPSIDDKKNEIETFLNISNTEYIFLVAHNNSNFDRFFFKQIFKNDAIMNPILGSKVKYIDSIHLAKYVLPHFKTFNLGYLCRSFGVEEGTHRATQDTLSLKLLFEKLVFLLSKKENIEYKLLMFNPDIIYDIIY